jgi:hypothetical protein
MLLKTNKLWEVITPNGEEETLKKDKTREIVIKQEEN